MKHVIDQSRRRLLQTVALGVGLNAIAWAAANAPLAVSAPLVTADDPTAKALKYTDDVSKAKDAKAGSTCANCALYQGAAGPAQGGCLLFPGKSVKSTGWCASWAPKTT
jgi:hypothetical protein